MEEVGNILRIFEETKQAIADNDTYKIKQLSNQTLHTATVSQDPDNIIVAVLIYSIGKILEREHYQEVPGWKTFYKSLIKNLDSAIISLKQNDIKKFRACVGEIRSAINSISSDLRIYIKDVFRKAEINKAFKIYEHGLSSQQTADLLGVSLWDLSSYIGQSSISEASASYTMPVKKRIKIAEEIFK